MKKTLVLSLIVGLLVVVILSIAPSRPVRSTSSDREDQRSASGSYVRQAVRRGTSQLGIEKSANDVAPHAGDRITYTITVRNPLTTTATGTVISDTLPGDLTFAGPVTLIPAQAGAIVATSTHSLPTLARNVTITGGEQITITLPITVNTDVYGRIVNSVAVSSAQMATPQISAHSIVVSNCRAQIEGDSTLYNSVQAAVDAADNGATVVASGYCAGVEARAGMSQTLFLTKSLTLRGGYAVDLVGPPDPIANPTTLDALGGGRAVVISGTVDVVLENLQFTHGFTSWADPNGGGIYVVGANIGISNCAIFSNTSMANGGGIYADRNISLNNTQVSDNVAGFSGGGLYVDTGAESVSIIASQILSNTLTWSGSLQGGGGIHSRAGAMMLVDSSVSGNTVDSTGDGKGGGVWNNIDSRMTISNSSISGNLATGHQIHFGGGIYNAGWLTVLDSTISGNRAEGGGGEASRGGGIFNQGSLTVTNSTVSGNQATEIPGSTTWAAHGGGIYCLNWANLTLRNSTVSGNSAINSHSSSAQGGGLYKNGNDGSVTLANTILASNVISAAGGFANGPDCFGVVSSLGHNLIQVGEDCSGPLNGLNGDIVGSGDEPIQPFVDALANNGGDVATHALLAGSPAINGGDPAFSATLAYDQRGPGYARVVGGRVDIGAYEAQLALVVTKTVTDKLAEPGQRITFTVGIHNSGLVDALGVSISDTLHVSLTLAAPVTIQPPGAGVPGTPPILGSGITLTAGGRLTVTVPVTVSPDLTGGTAIVNTAALTSTELTIPEIGSVGILVGEFFVYLPLEIRSQP